MQIVLHREAIEKMVRHHLLSLGDGREVIRAVPMFQLVQQSHQQQRIVLAQGHSDTGSIADERFDSAQEGP